MKKSARRFLAMLLVGIMIIGCFAGCAKETEQEPVAETTKPAESTEKAESTETEEEKSIHPVTTEPITISILTQRHSNATNNAEDIWFFNYLEYWLAEEYGYNITLDVQQSEEASEQISLMLGTDSLPDLVWSIDLSPNNTVIYGDGQGLVMDWTPYLNDEYMPHVSALLEADQDALNASTSIDGKIYSIPKMASRAYGNASSTIGVMDRLFVNTTWLKECGLEMPTNIDEFLDMLRTFKSQMKLESGEEVIPALSNADFLDKAIWLMMGYYGSSLSKYGNEFCIKDGKLAYPVYSEDYKTYIDIMKTMYEEGLISQDYFSMDGTTMRGLTQAGVAGVISDWTLGSTADYMEWESIPWFTIGDNDQVVVSTGSTFNTGQLWASSRTEYPEVVALIVDYLYSPEGTVAYTYGPQEGQDPLGMVDGWYIGEDGKITTKMVEDGVYDNIELWAYQYIRSHDDVGYRTEALEYAYEEAGQTLDVKEYELLDTITNKTFIAKEYNVYTHDDAQGHWFITNTEASLPYITQVRLPAVYQTEDEALRAQELVTVLKNHISSESAKFITGVRPVGEIDQFFEELESMGIEEYIALYEKAYSSYLSMYFD